MVLTKEYLKECTRGCLREMRKEHKGRRLLYSGYSLLISNGNRFGASPNVTLQVRAIDATKPGEPAEILFNMTI